MQSLSKSNNINQIYSFDTEYSADSVEWCPHHPNQNIFVCANYHLTENKLLNDVNRRTGRILLFSVTPEDGLKLLQCINTSAVLDQKWCHTKIHDCSILGVVNASQRIEMYKLNIDKFQLDLITSYSIENNTTETLILSLDWSTGKYKCDEPEIICSDSKGNVHLFKFIGNELVLVNTWHGHDFEAWISGFYYWDTNIFFSGGDDSVLLKFDKRIGKEVIAKNHIHNAGVTALHSNSSREYIIATGSYDEYVRLWDIRNIKRDVNSIKMPGTLWRLKWDPFYQNYLSAACMLNGAHIINVNNNEQMDIIGSFYGHKNIVYGVDWCYLEKEHCGKFEGEGNILIGTCSFYDCLLCISKFNSVEQNNT